MCSFKIVALRIIWHKNFKWNKNISLLNYFKLGFANDKWPHKPGFDLLHLMFWCYSC